MIELWELSRKLKDVLGENATKVPYITFPANTEVSVIFPFNGAAARFLVCRRDNPKDYISVYLDTVEHLGFFGGKPYWEAHAIDGDTARFGMDEAEHLSKAIGKELLKRKRARREQP